MNKPQILPSGNARIRITGPDGARHSVTEATPRKAERAAKALLGKLHAEHQAKLDAKVAATEARKNPRRRFDLYAESYLHTRRPGEPYGYTQVVYRRRLNHLRILNETFGNMFVQDITPQDVRDWWTSRSATPSHRSSLYGRQKVPRDRRAKSDIDRGTGAQAARRHARTVRQAPDIWSRRRFRPGPALAATIGA